MFNLCLNQWNKRSNWKLFHKIHHPKAILNLIKIWRKWHCKQTHYSGLLNLLHVLAQREKKKVICMAFWDKWIRLLGFSSPRPYWQLKDLRSVYQDIKQRLWFSTWGHTGITWEVRKNVSFSPSRFLLHWSGHQDFLIPPGDCNKFSQS